MENFLPALLIIGGVIYKIYTEFQKEQEKARQRRPSAPPVSAKQIPVPTPVMAAPKTDNFPTSTAQPYSEMQQPRYEEAYSSYQGFVPEEVQKVKRSREKTKIKELKVENLADEKVDFNLREAIIQSVILNRPYRD